MQGGCREQLVTTETEDGIRLDGAWIRPADGPARPIAIVWVHGGGTNFYHPSYLRIGRGLAVRHYAFITGNTRGHDYGAWNDRARDEPLLGGVAWEHLEESPTDVAAWIDFAVAHGFRRVALVGHSLGALKVTAYQAGHQDYRASGLGICSPPLRPRWNTRAYPDVLARAEQLVADGRPEQLLRGPDWWIPLSAQTWLSTDRFDLDQFGREHPAPPVAQVRCPLLALCGTEEPDTCLAEDLEVIRRNAIAAPRIECHVIEGADHFYTGHELHVAEVIAMWVDTLA